MKSKTVALEQLAKEGNSSHRIHFTKGLLISCIQSIFPGEAVLVVYYLILLIVTTVCLLVRLDAQVSACGVGDDGISFSVPVTDRPRNTTLACLLFLAHLALGPARSTV